MPRESACPACDGSGGGGYPCECPTCGGRGYVRASRSWRDEPVEDYEAVDDVDLDAEVRW